MLAALLSALLLIVPVSGAPAERPLPIAAGGGVTLSGTLTVPPGPGPHPAAVVVGGFGPTGRDGGFGGGGLYRTLAAGLAQRGIAVLRYDKRGIGESDGGDLSWLDARLLARDAGAATRALAALPGVDRRRVALIGHSQGGDLALRAAATAPATRVVTLAAPGRPLGALPRVGGRGGPLLARVVGPGAARATLRRDPLRDAARARQPALLVHGTRDRTVPPADLSRLATARRAAGRPTRTLLVPGAGHFLERDGQIPPAVLDAVAAFVG